MKNNSRARSCRKPLSDISNGGKSLKPQCKKKIPENEEEEQPQREEAVLDRLLLAHSDLSKLINQIDELVAQALNVKMTNRKGIKEIESFTDVLSDMHSSLKSWIPRFQKALSSPTMESTNQLGQTSPIKTFPTVNEEINDVENSPQQLQLSPRISPSPLVSWCTEHTIESGRQLFLLTPLPRPKGLSSKRHGPSRSVFESKMDNPFTTFRRTSLLNISEIPSDDLLEGIEMKSPPTKSCKSAYTEISEHGFVSPPKFSNRESSMFLMTPCLKMSPPKSCVLLEPIAESFQQDHRNIPKLTPFHVGKQNYSSPDTSEPSSEYFSKSLALKYPEFFGIQMTQKDRKGSAAVEASPGWSMSPPKSCVLMEPPKEIQPTNLLTDGHLSSFVLDKHSDTEAGDTNKDTQWVYHSTKKICNQEFCSAKANLECTPMWKESASRLRTSKQPGENTLKRELWTKFEAASSNVLRFDDSVFLETGKGFLDRLEEVYCEDMTSVTEKLR